MKLKTNQRDIFSIKIEPAETLFIEFSPDGLNEPLTNGKMVGFSISTVTLPSGDMALSISFPQGRLYRVPNGPFILCDLVGYKRVAFDRDGSPIELEAVE